MTISENNVITTGGVAFFVYYPTIMSQININQIKISIMNYMLVLYSVLWWFFRLFIFARDFI
ncbi:hypothetical protein D9980_19345 [Serratia sp. 3ACOL1]|nr:hypothetical protein D9980_19345 [Serratia sp. 3ACOL1]